MNIDQLNERFPDESSCRRFFESINWRDGRFYPHCQCNRSYPLNGSRIRLTSMIARIVYPSQ